jgi:pyruvate/2-oxoglutarate dehydrogenase complex dihydrolipoamide dehydrogenase (E3) component
LPNSKTLAVNVVLVAAGRQSNTADLNLAATGLKADDNAQVALPATQISILSRSQSALKRRPGK